MIQEMTELFAFLASLANDTKVHSKAMNYPNYQFTFRRATEEQRVDKDDDYRKDLRT